ncbi:MAG: SAM-dependent methyltransferase, partial [Spirochaetales bacterium]|nr:SAM-dependent methyltransferase [Spirochaetales bacterium]
PNRPSPLGVTTVKLLKIEGEVLSVSGLDAVDGSPVYDIKPYAKVFDEIDGEKTGRDWCLTNPRSPMAVLIGSNDLAGCLSEAGKLHGHFCPGLSLGVYAAVTGMKRIASSIADGMEGLCAVIEVNSCFADGIQAVTGCTFGNNSLIYRDIGKTAVTLAHRGKPEGLRIMVKPAFREILQKDFPVYSLLFDRVVRERGGDEKDMADFKEKGREASFGILSYPSDSLFIVREVPVTLPPYAPMVNSLRCDRCGEEVMETKTVKKDGLLLCRSCGGGYPCLTGAGIVCHCG